MSQRLQDEDRAEAHAVDNVLKDDEVPAEETMDYKISTSSFPLQVSIVLRTC